MRRFTQILAATDFSEAGNNAVDAAFGLAQGGHATVHVVHVMDRPHIPNPLYAHYVPESAWQAEGLQKAIEEATRELERLVPEDARQSGVSVDVRVAQADSPQEEILRMADELGIEAIVLGTRGSALEQMLLGSVTERVVRKATCAVMCVH